MNRIKNRIYVSNILARSETDLDTFSPDEFTNSSALHVEDSFVICLDLKGHITAQYGDDLWDLTPYRLTTTGCSKFDFSKIKKTGDTEYDELTIKQVKAIVFSLIYFAKSGRTGCLSPCTIYKYVASTINVANFCLDFEKFPMIGRISVFDFLSNEVYLKKYASSLSSREQIILHALLGHLNKIGSNKLGLKAKAYSWLDHKIKANQHPVIPARIYIELLNQTSIKLELYSSKIVRLEKYIEKLKDPAYALNKKGQKKKGISSQRYRPDFPTSIKEEALQVFFEDCGVAPRSRKSISTLISKIQYDMLILIHLYTGMRKDEVRRLPYNCISSNSVNDEIIDENGNTLLLKKTIKIISTTTKYSGYKKEATWLAPSIVAQAVKVLQALVRGMAKVNDLTPEDCPLIGSPLCIINNVDVMTPKISMKEKVKSSFKVEAFHITKEDRDILKASDPDRDFSSDPKFDIGQPWPLTTHQLRRSLAFYAVNSGFVSLPTVRNQFKHLSQEMSKYYSRNFEKVNTIFGNYDVKTKSYVLPQTHFAYEIQIGVSLDTANNLITDIVGEAPLFGKSGGFLEKQKQRFLNGEIPVEELKEDTAKRVEKGEISYRKTLLGGCTNLDTCECSLLGEFSDCLTSECAVIKSSNIDSLIDRTQNELDKYDVNSVEFLSTQAELQELLNFKKRRLGSI
ncbi:hypothetical protein AB6D84_21115 [Vibrio lentus]